MMKSGVLALAGGSAESLMIKRPAGHTYGPNGTWVPTEKAVSAKEKQAKAQGAVQGQGFLQMESRFQQLKVRNTLRSVGSRHAVLKVLKR